MNGADFERFQANAQGCGVLFYYAGEFTPAVIAAAADSLKARLATEDASGPAKRKLFSTFVEMAHNILHYAVATAAEDGSTPAPHGAIGVGREKPSHASCAGPAGHTGPSGHSGQPGGASDNTDTPQNATTADATDMSSHYWIVCSNPVNVDYVARLADKLNAVRAMSLDEIKQSYREQLRNTDHGAQDPISKGAGLGLLTIARDASGPLEYSFASTADPTARTALFHVKARI